MAAGKKQGDLRLLSKITTMKIAEFHNDRTLLVHCESRKGTD
ncbi:hypothetical protein [uncultured Alistipes sp.]|jgi:hypothetical protein|nr:hypothetical protein [uncultured Alistipes sp.]